MYSKISNWLLIQDEKFLSMVKEEAQRRKLLDQLYAMRLIFVFSFLIPITLLIIQVVLDVSDPVPMLLFLLFMLVYFVTDSTIRAVKLYELSLAADQKS